MQLLTPFTSPLVISTTGFDAAGTSKLVVVISVFNSNNRVSPITDLTYGGVSFISNIAVANTTISGTNGTPNKMFIAYLDSPLVDGNLVLTFTDTNTGVTNTTYQIDEVGVALFALNGAAAGTAYYTATRGTAAYSPTPSFDVTAGDLVIGMGLRSGGTSATVTDSGYTGVDLFAGEMNAEVAYGIAASSGTIGAPVITGISGVTGSGATESMAAFAAIPEPSSFGLAVIGGLFFLRRRR